MRIQLASSLVLLAIAGTIAYAAQNEPKVYQELRLEDF
jgi:hypothetical protein